MSDWVALRYQADCGAEIRIMRACPDGGQPVTCTCGAEFVPVDESRAIREQRNTARRTVLVGANPHRR